MKSSRWCAALGVALAVFSGWGGGRTAQALMVGDRAQLNAYVSQGFSKFFHGSAEQERTDLNNTLYAVQGTFRLNDTLSLRSELEGQDTFFTNIIHGANDNTSLQPEIVVAAIDLSPWSGHKLRVGLMRQPYGFYNEVRSIDIAFPFTRLPLSYYPVLGNMVTNLRGVSYHAQGGWGDNNLLLVLYGGQAIFYSMTDNQGAIDPTVMDISNGADNLAFHGQDLENLTGGHLEYGNFDLGIKAVASASLGWLYEGTDEEPWYSWMVGAQWETDWTVISSEYGQINEWGETYYVFAGLKPIEGITLTGTWERSYPNRRTRTDISLEAERCGVNWEIYPELLLKGSYAWSRVGSPLGAINNEIINVTLAAALF